MRALAVAAAVMLLLAGRVAGQGGGCFIEPGPRTNVVTYGPTTYVSGTTEFLCADGVYVKADSAFVTGEVRTLIGNVVYRDSTRALTAQRVVYTERQAHINAQGQVVFVDRETGSTLRGQVLDYWREQPGRPERVILSSGRPNAVIVRQDSVTLQPDTTIIDANLMDIAGKDAFLATGSVEIRRTGGLIARAQRADYNEPAGRMILIGQASVQDSAMHLIGDSIHTFLRDGEFSQVDAYRNAKILSDDMDVESDRLHIVLDTGVVQRLIAVGTTDRQAHASSPQFEVTADSIDAIAPGQKLDRAIAVGNAEGVRTDSLDVSLPSEIARDWLRGDTVIAIFTAASDSLIRARRAAGDTTSSDRVLERLIASGATGPATTLYRTREANDTTNQVSVIYTAARRIEVLLKNGEVESVNATDELKGLYLQPIRREQVADVPRSSTPRPRPGSR